METTAQASKILDNMLGYLGFVVDVRSEETVDGPLLQVYTQESEFLIGCHGERLDDLQYLVNRLLRARGGEAPQVRVDVEHYRDMREDGLLERIRSKAERVRITGIPVTLSPMNAYYRRLVHRAFHDDPDIVTSSPGGGARVKSVTLARNKPGAADGTAGAK